MSTKSSADDVRQRKRALRREIRTRLKETPQEAISLQSQKVWHRLFALPEYVQARSVGLFLSMPSGEIETDTALMRVLDDGKTLYVPRVGLDFDLCDMEMIRVDVNHETQDAIVHSQKKAHNLFYHDWPRNKWGIPEPPVADADAPEVTAQPGDIDLLVVPGLAFDRLGGRLGQGKGYYDRFIARMSDDGKGGKIQKKPLLVAVALEASFVDDEEEGGKGESGVPVMEHDYTMDIVLHPTETIIIPRG